MSLKFAEINKTANKVVFSNFFLNAFFIVFSFFHSMYTSETQSQQKPAICRDAMSKKYKQFVVIISTQFSLNMDIR